MVVADGSEGPATAEVIRQGYPKVRLVPNPQRIIGYGIAAAMRSATGAIIVRCDAHTFLRPGYLRRAVETLSRTGAAVVGGRQNPVGSTLFERAVAMAMSSMLGAGGARYRLGGPEGPADTVFLGVFRRDALEAVGGVDPDLVRGEDYELHWRLRERGETVWFDPELVVEYRPRGTLKTLASQFFDYGRWKRIVLRRHPGAVLFRHRAGAALVGALAISAVLALVISPWAGAVVPSVYLTALAAGSLVVGIRRRAFVAALLPLVLATMQLSWGIGFFFPPRDRTSTDSFPAGEERPRHEQSSPG